MTSEDKNVVRGDYETLTFTVSGDITARKLTFVVKETKTLTAPRIIQRANALAGGSSSQMTATYTSPSTTIKVFLQPALTSQLAAKSYYYDLTSEDASSSDDHKTIKAGKLNIIGDVQSPYDGVLIGGSMNANKWIRFYVADDSTVTELSSYGWVAKPTAEIASDIITVKSSGSEFVVGKTIVLPTNWNVNWDPPTISEVVLTAYAGAYPFSFEVYI